jgi:hypothetical protein
MPAAPYQAVADGVVCIDTGTAHTVPGLLGVIAELGLTP